MERAHCVLGGPAQTLGCLPVRLTPLTPPPDRASITRLGRPRMADGEPVADRSTGRSNAPEPGARGLPGRTTGHLTEPGDHLVRSDIVCQITRFGLRRPFDLVRTYLDFRRTRRRARHVPGFLCATFVLEDARTCYTLSLWRDLRAIADFGTSTPEHLAAARQVMGRLRFQRDRGPELWSTKWRLLSVSSNLNWGSLDLRSRLESPARASDG